MDSAGDFMSEERIKIRETRVKLRCLDTQIPNDISAFAGAVTCLSNSINRIFSCDEKTILSQLKNNPEIAGKILKIIKKMNRIFVLFSGINIPSPKTDFNFNKKQFNNDEKREEITFRSALTIFSKCQVTLLSKHSPKSINEYKSANPDRITELLSLCIAIKEGLAHIDKLLNKRCSASKKSDL